MALPAWPSRRVRCRSEHDGRRRGWGPAERWTADPNAAIDCFYVYPTVSTDPTPNSDMNADPAELNVVRTQFARFGSKCRPYAPMYRQITLAGLRRSLATGAAAPWGAGPHYSDVRDAWNYYLQHDNKGRDVVLVGHSQDRSSRSS